MPNVITYSGSFITTKNSFKIKYHKNINQFNTPARQRSPWRSRELPRTCSACSGNRSWRRRPPCPPACPNPWAPGSRSPARRCRWIGGWPRSGCPRSGSRRSRRRSRGLWSPWWARPLASCAGRRHTGRGRSGRMWGRLWVGALFWRPWVGTALWTLFRRSRISSVWSRSRQRTCLSARTVCLCLLNYFVVVFFFGENK